MALFNLATLHTCYCALASSAYSGEVEIVGLLLECGVDVNLTGDQYGTAIG